MKLYNTASREIEEFVPQNPKQVKIYTCGPTVYSFAHIGNFTAYVYWDLLIRTMQLNGWNVKRVLNITDVGHLVSDADEGEDKMEKGARREGKTVWEVAQMYTDDFLKNFRELGLLEPANICRATDYIEQDEKLVDALDKGGYLYDTTDGLYFDTSKFERYADFAHLDLENLQAGARIEFSDEKRNVSDFAVWKWIREGEDHAMKWEYRGRMGYPGWHLECSTIIHEELGEPIDIHCGGIDHIPIHHTNEIAQTEAAFNTKMANFWMHCNFIMIDGQKISKSLGNVYYLSDLKERGYSPVDFKVWLYQGHYQAERDFTFEQLAAAHARLMNYRNFAVLRWQDAEKSDFAEEQAQILEFLNTNLNSAGAFAVIDAVAKSGKAPSDKFLKFLDEAFGFDIAASTPDISNELKGKISARVAAKAERDFETADRLRDEISEAGIELLDSATSVRWKYKD
ncbi:cysteine--tRNA ligase [Candidatus Saccharibacteria bacterium]|nr:cysteine--tRNA ligase [Candidatus Saccharibacteria bacterium]